MMDSTVVEVSYDFVVIIHSLKILSLQILTSVTPIPVLLMLFVLILMVHSVVPVVMDT